MVSILSLNGKAEVVMKFTVPMATYINPVYTAAQNDKTNVTTALSNFLRVTHQQQNMYTKVNTKMPDPTFTAVSFDGLLLTIQVVFPDPAMLSQSLTDKKDILFFDFN